MKKPLRLLLSRKGLALLLLLAAGAIYCARNVESIRFLKDIVGKEGENEEEESAAEAFGPMDYWGQERTYPSGELNAKAYMEAFQHMQMMPQWLNKVHAQSRIEASNWTPLGPMNFSGRVLSLAFDPSNANNLWAGSCGGGLWRSTSGGTGAAGGINWTQVPTGFPITSVPSIAVNPTNANELFIGTGEVYSTGGNGFTGQDTRTFRGSYGIGVLKTTNGGGTWTQTLTFPNSNVDGVYEIKYAPGNPSIIFAGTSDGLYRTTNSGTSWTRIFNTPLVMDMEFVPTDPNRLLITVGDLGSAGTGIYKSYNALSGSPTFAQITAGLPTVINGMIRISFPPDKANKVYASVGKMPGTGSCGAPCNSGFYTSTDTGNTWSKPASQPTLGGSAYLQNQGWYAHDVLAAPVSNNSIYVSEIDMTKSTDGGATWAGNITDWSAWDLGAGGGTTVGDPTEGAANAANYVHADHHHIYLSPFDATFNTIWVVCDGGVFKSTNGGTSWTSCNGGLMTAQIYHNMSVHPTNSGLMLCGLQDNATLYYQGATGCRRVTGGDGFYTDIDPTNANFCYATYSYGTWYRSSTGLGGFGGATWNNATNTVTSTPTEYAAFVAPVVLSNNGNTLYVGTNLLRKFTSPRTTTTNTIGNSGNPITGPTNSIMAIAVSKTFSDSIYLSTAPGAGFTGRMYRSANGGTAVTNISTGLPDRYFSSIAVDSPNSQRIAITVAGFGTGHVFLSTNGGTTWTDISGTGATALPDVPTNIVRFDKSTPTTLYVGNDLGVFAAQNVTNGATQTNWYSYNAGWTDVTPVMDILEAPNGKLRAGTFGKGLWENAKVVGSLPVTFESFTATPTDKGNQLTWVIGVQDNVSHYEVEYSTDMVNFAAVGTIPARAGTIHLTYSFLHKINNVKTGYYRIKVVDLDGDVMYSAIELVKGQQLISNFITYPNPTTGVFRVKMPTSIQGTFHLKLYDVAGKLVYSQEMRMQQGVTETDINISQVAAGNYQLICQDDKSKFVTRIIKR